MRMNRRAACGSWKSTPFALLNATGLPPTVPSLKTGPCTERIVRYLIVCGGAGETGEGGGVTPWSRMVNGVHLPLYMYAVDFSVGGEPSSLQSSSTNVSLLSPFALVPLHAKSIPWPISGYGAAPGNATPLTAIPAPCSSYSLKICGE